MATTCSRARASVCSGTSRTRTACRTLRSPNAVAKLQNVNQTIFHSLCSYTFDPDEGYCAFDRVNDPRTFGFISQILSGLGSLGGVVLDGVETIRVEPNGVIQRESDFFKSTQFLAVNPLATQTGNNQDLGLVLQPGQAALLGCGVAYASPCSERQATQWKNDPAIAASLSRNPADGPPQFGGIDLMNADGSVITQELVGREGALAGRVGRHPPRPAPAALLPDGHQLQPQRAARSIRPIPGIGPVTHEQGEYLDLTPNQVLNLGRVGRAEFQIDPQTIRRRRMAGSSRCRGRSTRST